MDEHGIYLGAATAEIACKLSIFMQCVLLESGTRFLA